MAYAHRNGSPNQKCSPADLVDEEEHDGREDDEQSVLHTGGDKLGVACKTSHGEDVYDVVSHDLRTVSRTVLREVCSTYISTRKLLPGLDGETGKSPFPHAVVDELSPSLGS